MSKNTTKTSANTSSMQLTQEQKEKFLSYLEMKGLPAPKGNETVSNIIDWLVEDIVKSNGNSVDYKKYTDYIFGYAFSNLTDKIDESHLEEFQKWVTEDNLDLFIITLFSNPEYSKIFILGAVYAYAKLTTNLNLEPNPELLALADFVFEATA